MNRLVPMVLNRLQKMVIINHQQHYHRPIYTSIHNLQSTTKTENEKEQASPRDNNKKEQEPVMPDDHLDTSTEHARDADNSNQEKTNGPADKKPDDHLVLYQEAEKKLRQITNLYQRSIADSENLRTRTKREIEQAHQFGIQKFAKDMLVISDTLALAINSVDTNLLKDSKPLRDLHEGLTLTSNELHNTFHRHGVTRIDAVEGDLFDPSIHQAVYQTYVPDRQPGTLVNVIKSGYKLHSRVIRAVQVGVVQEKKEESQVGVVQEKKEEK